MTIYSATKIWYSLHLCKNKSKTNFKKQMHVLIVIRCFFKYCFCYVFFFLLCANMWVCMCVCVFSLFFLFFVSFVSIFNIECMYFFINRLYDLKQINPSYPLYSCQVPNKHLEENFPNKHKMLENVSNLW